MSKSSYESAKKFFLEADSFEAAIMAAVMKADTSNLAKLTLEWPAIVEEVHARYDAPGALLPHEIQEPGQDGDPKIYVFINSRFASGDVTPIALAEDGTVLASHFCSSESWAKHDMGLESTWKHKEYTAHYPDGWQLIWVESQEVLAHPGVQAALAKNRELKEQHDAAEHA